MKLAALRWVIAAALAVAGCQPPAQVAAPEAVVATFAIDRTQAIDALAARPNALWQDALFTTKDVQERRKTSRYHLQAATAGNAWAAAATLPGTSTNGVAYAHHDTSFGDQPAGPIDVVWAVSDNGMVSRLKATDGSSLGAPYNALAGLPLTGTVTRSAIILSGKNDRVYLLTTGGYFIMLDAMTGVRLAAVRLSATGFSNIAPFIDYSNSGGTPGYFNDEYVYALAGDGSLYQVRVNGSIQIRGWRATGGTDAVTLGTGLGNVENRAPAAGPPAVPGSWAVSNLGITTGLNYGVSLTDRCKASPLVWKGIAYFGGTDGRFYRVRTAAGALDVLPLSARGIETSPAIEFDTTPAMDVTDVFVPAGDRLHWIDPTSAASLSRKAISPPLVLNAKPASASAGASGILRNYTYSGATTALGAVTATDWIAAATADVPAVQGPSRWGDGARELGAIDAGGNPSDVKVAPDGQVWFTVPGSNVVKRADPTTFAVTDTYNGDGNYASLVKNIPVNNTPTGLTKDPEMGGVWVSCYNADSVMQIDKDGVVVRTITGVPKPTGLAYDQRGTTGNTADDVLWVCSTTGSLALATGALLKIQLSNGAITSYTNANTAAGARNYNDFGNGTPGNNTALASNAWNFRGPQGVVVTGDGHVWVANSLENMSMDYQNSGRPLGYPFDLDGTDITDRNAARNPDIANNQNGVSADRSSIMVFDPGTSQFTARIICEGAPYGMAYSSQGGGSVWVGTYRWGADVVERYDQRVSQQYNKLFRSVQTSNHWQPRWVAVDDPNNRMWVVNGNSEGTATVATNGLDAVRANATGSQSMSGGGNFLGTYQTGTQPRGVDVDSTGSAWVANSTATTVTRYAGNGTPLGTYPVQSQPYAVVVDKFDVAWVANQASNTVSRISGSTLPPVLLNDPRGLTFDAANNVWIANHGNKTLTVMNQNGNIVLPKIDTNAQPYGMAAAGAQMWVAINGDEISHRVNRTTGAVTNVDFGNNNERGLWVDTDGTGRAFFSVPGWDELKRVTAAGTVTTLTNNVATPHGVAVNPANGDVWVANFGDGRLLNFAGGNTTSARFTVDGSPEGVAAKGNQAWVTSQAQDSLTRVNAVTGGGRVAVGTLLGTLSSFAAAAVNPTQLAIDAYDNVWMANGGAARVHKIWHAGAQDLIAAQHYRGTDGNGSYAYMRFPIANNAFGGRTPVAARVLLTAASNSARTSESIRLTGATNAMSATTAWGGFATTPTVAWNAHPAQVPWATTTSARSLTNGNSYWFDVEVFPELHDASAGPWDPTNGAVTYAIQSQGVSLADVAHIATSTAANRPRLEVTVTNTRLPATAGLRSQPTLDGYNKRLYVMGTNAVFELRYDSPANFSDPSKIAYSFTQSGLTSGPLQGNNVDYAVPTGASTLTYSGKLVTIDYAAQTDKTALNAFTLNFFGPPPYSGFYLNPSGNNTAQLATSVTVDGPFLNSQLTYDYDRGAVYLVSGNKVMGYKLLQ